MDPVARQYEAFPYPARDPGDEAKRLVTGSPSLPLEIDHYLFNGRRDWTAPFRVLVAGGGTGDAAIMLGQLLKDRGTPAEILYLDRSRASREIAEARAAARGLSAIRFETGDLLNAPDHGPFDYIDCCGVLHHLPDPQAGFDALAAALSPEGGLGAMVYAPHGRAGVYALQDALRPLIEGLPPQEQVAVAREALKRLPQAHPFARNPLIGDHLESDAGLYDLLLHSRDEAFEADAVFAALEKAGLRLASFVQPARYRPETYLGKALAKPLAALDPPAQAVMAERFCGAIRKHVFYAAPAARGDTVARPGDAALIPVLKGVEPAALAKAIAANGGLRLTVEGVSAQLRLERSSASLAGRIDGRSSLKQLQESIGSDWIRFSSAFGKLAETLCGFDLMLFSRFQGRGS